MRTFPPSTDIASLNSLEPGDLVLVRVKDRDYPQGRAAQKGTDNRWSLVGWDEPLTADEIIEQGSFRVVL